MTEKHCRACGALLMRRATERAQDWNKRTTCNAACGHKAAAAKRYAEIPRFVRRCEHCNGEIRRRPNQSWPSYRKARYCSPACQIVATRKPAPVTAAPLPETRVCASCGATFCRPRKTSLVAWARAQFCGNACRAKARWSGRTTVNRRASRRAARKRAASAPSVAPLPQIRPPVEGPRFATVEEWLAHHGTETARAGMIHYSATNDTGPIPVKPFMGERSFR